MKTILIVEDDFHIQEIYRMAFVKTGEYSVETASDGQEALIKLSNHVYDVILLDIMLPKVTGIDVLRAIRNPSSNSKNIPVILITNLGQDDIIKEAFKIGADGYLIKAQFTPQDVVKEVGAFFDQLKQIEEQASSSSVVDNQAQPQEVPAQSQQSNAQPQTQTPASAPPQQILTANANPPTSINQPQNSPDGATPVPNPAPSSQNENQTSSNIPITN